jgi:mitogen-activated protein kinase kinase
VDPEQEMQELEEHLTKLTLALNGQEPDAGDLDNEGWRAVSQLGRIETLGGLGEGAGGAVTRCMLKGGRTVFALKVRHLNCRSSNMLTSMNRSSPPTRIPT